MNGALNFTLGLQANQFLNSLGVASGRLVGFLGIANGIQMAFNKMWQAIEKGGQLKDLAAAASLSVKDLYRLRRGFEEVGAAAESVPAVINRLRRTLGSGEQNGLLAGMGLDPKTLGQMNPAAQFEQIAQVLAKLNVNARSQAAQKLFGREGAQTIQQIANSGEDFAQAMARATKDATIWDKVSGTFDSIGDKLKEIEAHFESMVALLVGALIEAFRQGKLGEVITDIIVTGFQAAMVMIPPMFVKLGEILLRVFQVPLAYLQAGIDYAIQKAQANPAWLAAMGIPITGPIAAQFLKDGPTFDQIFQERLAEGVKFNFGTGEFGLGDISASANKFLGEGFSKAGGLLAALQERLMGLIGAGKGFTTGGLGGGGSALPANIQRSDFTSVEKMGFVMSGLGRGFGGDHSLRISHNTAETNKLLRRTNELLSGIDVDFTNQ